MDWQASTQTTEAPTVIGVAEPHPDTVPATRASEAAGDWLCAWCLNRVANDQDRFRYQGEDEFTFSNPEGLSFQIITFCRTLGCRPTGEPTLEHTWFPGHAWSLCHCDSCGQQLGWFYAGPTEFAGLIKARIVRALWVRN